MQNSSACGKKTSSSWVCKRVSLIHAAYLRQAWPEGDSKWLKSVLRMISRVVR